MSLDGKSWKGEILGGEILGKGKFWEGYPGKGPSRPAARSRGKKALWHRVHEALQDLARRVSTTAHQPSSAGEPQCTKPLALRRRCNATTTSPELDHQRLLRKAGGARVQSRALYEAAGGGAGPAGSQRRPQRLSRQAGVRSL